MNPSRLSSSQRRQTGAVLVVGLILLTLLTLIGVASFSVATQQERMSSATTRDRMRALEAAEASLRDCEAFIGGPVPPLFSAYAPNSAPSVAGMYLANEVGSTEIWKIESVWTATGQARVLSTNTLPDVAAQPRCIVERLVSVPSSMPSRRAELPLAGGIAYRITARGFGNNRTTVATLQGFYLRD